MLLTIKVLAMLKQSLLAKKVCSPIISVHLRLYNSVFESYC